MVFNYIRGTYVLGNPEGISISNPFFEMGVLWKNKSSATTRGWPVSRLGQFQGSWKVRTGGDFRDQLDQFLHFQVRRPEPEVVRGLFSTPELS